MGDIGGFCRAVVRIVIATSLSLMLCSAAAPVVVADGGLVVYPLPRPVLSLPESYMPPVFQTTTRDCACAAFVYLARREASSLTLSLFERVYGQMFGYQIGDYCQPLQVEQVLHHFGIGTYNATRWDWPPPMGSVTYLYAGAGITHAVDILHINGSYVEYFDSFPYTSFHDRTGIFFMSTTEFRSDWAGWWTMFSAVATQ